MVIGISAICNMRISTFIGIIMSFCHNTDTVKIKINQILRIIETIPVFSGFLSILFQLIILHHLIIAFCR